MLNTWHRGDSLLERISTGIEGLDVMLKGGLIKGRAYLIKGGPGSGKTILSMQILLEGAKRGEKVAYVTLMEPEDKLRENMSALGFDLSKVNIIDLSPTSDHPILMSVIEPEKGIDLNTFRSVLENILVEAVDIIAIDPITMFKAMMPETQYRAGILRLIRLFRRKLGSKSATVILISSSLELVDIDDYLVDGVIELRTVEVGGRIVRALKIVKMRGSDFDEVLRPYRITNRGIEVYPDLSVSEV